MTDAMQERMRDKKGARARRLSSQQVRADIYSRKGESQLEAIARLDREIQAEQTRDALLRAGMVV